MNIKELRSLTGMTQKAFAEYFNIPVRTLEDWEGEKRTPSEYVTELIKYKLEKERLMMRKFRIFREVWNLHYEEFEVDETIEHVEAVAYPEELTITYFANDGHGSSNEMSHANDKFDNEDDFLEICDFLESISNH